MNCHTHRPRTAKEDLPRRLIQFRFLDFERAVAEAWIRDFTWHSLRHTFCSRLVQSGVDLRTVQELSGHSTIGMVVRYAHLAPKHASDAIEKLAAYALGAYGRG